MDSRIAYAHQTCLLASQVPVMYSALLVALGASLSAIAFFNRSLNEQVETLHREDVVWRDYHHQNAFPHCRYEKVRAFNTEHCNNRCGLSAFMWRHHKLTASNKDPTCLDRYEQMDCMDKATNYECKAPMERITQCLGVYNVKMPQEMVTSDSEVIAPLLANLTEFLGQNVLAQDLFTLCPRCRVSSEPFNLRKEDVTCVRQLLTVRKGWPYHMELCDDIEENVNCKMVKELA
uniref:Kazal-like domain-containing protein n=1 Tax=Steinernema glaseri TaxID=37863 RepID=A0A1I7ZKQ9_9BILA